MVADPDWPYHQYTKTRFAFCHQSAVLAGSSDVKRMVRSPGCPLQLQPLPANGELCRRSPPERWLNLLTPWTAVLR